MIHLLVIVFALSGEVSGVFDVGTFEGDGSPTHARWECEGVVFQLQQDPPVVIPNTTVKYECTEGTET